MSNCHICLGLGVIEKDNKSFECQCSFIKRISAAMPLYIRKAIIKKEHLELPIFGMLRRHIMVVASWADGKSVLKGLMIGNPGKLIKITSDREIRDVYVGSKSRAAKGDEDGKIYNSLEDLMEPPDLMVIRLNELSYKNKAASGALEEAINYRVDRDKPTWLFSDIDKPFTIGSFAFSDSVSDIIKTYFITYRINRILPNSSYDMEDILPIEIGGTEPVTKPVMQTQEAISKSLTVPIHSEASTNEEKPPEISRKPKIRPSEDEDADVGLSMYGSGLSGGKKYKRKS